MRKLNSLLLVPALLAAAVSLQAQGVTVDKTQLTFTAQVGTTPTASQTVNVSAAAAGTFYIAQSNASWLKISNATNATPQAAISGTTPSAVSVIADPTGLQGGSYSGVISFTGGITVAVSFTVAAISVSPQTAALGVYQAGSTTYPAQIVLNVSGATNGFTISKAQADTWYTAAILGTPANAVVVQFNQANASSLTVGAYNGTLTITPTGLSNNTPITVPVTLSVAASPQVTVAPTSLSFNWQAGGTNNQNQQTLQFTSNAAVPISFSASSSGAGWIVPPANGFIQPAGSAITVGVNGGGLQPGTYNGSLTFTISGGLFPNNQPTINIPIQLTVSNFPLLNVTPAALTFNYQFGSGSANLPAAQSITPSSTGAPNTQVQYTVSATPSGTWLTIPAGLLSSGTPFSVSVNPGSLAPQTYTGTVTLTPVANGSGQAAIAIPITLNVTNLPALQLSSTSLVFPYQLGQAAPATQTITVSSSSGAALNYTVTAPSNAPWLQLGGTLNGTTDQTWFSVGVNTTNAVAGSFNATVTVTATDPSTGAAVGTPVAVTVNYYVSANPLLTVTPPGPIALSALQNSASQQVTINLSSTNNTTGNQLAIGSVQINAPWLSSTQAPTATPGSFTVTAVPNSSMSPGTYSGTIVVNATGPGGAALADSPYTIPVTLQLNAANATVAPTSLTFAAQLGGAAAPAQTLNISSNGVPLPFSAVPNDGGIGWLTVTNGTGTTAGTVSVSVNASRLSTGTYFGAVYVNVANGGGSPFRIPVTFNVTAGAISAPTTTLTFTQAAGAAVPPTQTIAVSGTPGPLNFSVTTDSAWLTAVVGTGTSASGTTPANVTVSVNAANLTVGPYNGKVIISSPGSTPSSITVPVVFNVVAPQTLTLSNTAALNFNYTIGVTQTPITQTVSLTSPGSVQFNASAATTDKGSWLSVSPATGTASGTATTLTVSVDPKNLAAGSYTGTITVSSPQVVTPLTLAVNLTVVAVPAPVLSSIKNAASYTTVAVSPGELVALFGTNLGPSTLTFGTVTGGKRATNVAGTQVLFGNTPAPIYYVSATQTAVFVPYEVGGQATTQVTVVTQGATSAAVTYNVVPAQPGIFTQNSQGTGPGSILNQDYSINGPNNGAAPGSIIQIYMTGEGETSPGGVTGSSIPSDGSGLKKPVLAVTASIGGISLPASSIVYAGSAPGTTSGVFQVDLIVPTTLGTGSQALTVSVGGVSSQPGVTVQVTAKP